MKADIEEVVRRAAAAPSRDPDIPGLMRRGRVLRRRQRSRRLAMGAVVAATLIGWGVVAGNREAPGQQLDVIAPPTESTVAPAPPATSTIVRRAVGDDLVLPAGWYRATVPMQSIIKGEVVSAATFPLPSTPSGPACDAQIAKAPVDLVGAGDAYVWVIEQTNPADRIVATPPRPASFDRSVMTAFDCEGRYPGLTFLYLWYRTGDAVVGVYVVLGPAISAEREADVWAIAASLR